MHGAGDRPSRLGIGNEYVTPHILELQVCVGQAERQARTLAGGIDAAFGHHAGQRDPYRDSIQHHIFSREQKWFQRSTVERMRRGFFRLAHHAFTGVGACLVCLAFRVVPCVVIPYVTRFAVGRGRIEKAGGNPALRDHMVRPCA